MTSKPKLAAFEAARRRPSGDGTEWLVPELLTEVDLPLPTVAASLGDGAGGSTAGGKPYVFSPELLYAFKAALLVGQPLLLTGEPGVGKTQAGLALAARLGIPVERFTTRSVTVAADLLYGIDDIRRFRDSHGAGRRALRDYVTLGPIALAVLRSLGPAYALEPGVFRDGNGIAATGWAQLGENFGVPAGPVTLGLLFPDVFDGLTGPVRTLVVVDEIDKAPRDTPNDLLVEFEEMRLHIRELGLHLKANAAHWPIVVLTANAERALPETLLRRCIFHTLTLSDATLRDIIKTNLRDIEMDGGLVDQALLLFRELRDPTFHAGTMSRPPSTAECIAAVRAMHLWSPVPSLADHGLRQAMAMAFGKTRADFAICEQAMARLWGAPA